MENQKEQQNQIQIMIQILINNLHPKCKNVLYSFYEHNIYILIFLEFDKYYAIIFNKVSM